MEDHEFLCDVCSRRIVRGPVYFDRPKKMFFCDECYTHEAKPAQKKTPAPKKR